MYLLIIVGKRARALLRGAQLCVQATTLGDHTMMIMDTPLPDSDGKLSAPLMIWATGRDPLTIYTRFILTSYIC